MKIRYEAVLYLYISVVILFPCRTPHHVSSLFEIFHVSAFFCLYQVNKALESSDLLAWDMNHEFWEMRAMVSWKHRTEPTSDAAPRSRTTEYLITPLWKLQVCLCNCYRIPSKNTVVWGVTSFSLSENYLSYYRKFCFQL